MTCLSNIERNEVVVNVDLLSLACKENVNLILF